MKKLLLEFFLSFSAANAQQKFNYKDYFKDDTASAGTPEDEINIQVKIKKDLIFKKTFELHNKLFLNKVFIDSIKVPVFAEFYSTTFKDNVDFMGTEFKEDADFSNDVFEKQVNFRSTSFNKIAFLSFLSVDSATKFEFYRADLPDLIDFSFNRSLGHIVDFTNANFDSTYRHKSFLFDSTYRHNNFFFDNRHFINIYNSDISKLKLDYVHFRLSFYDIFHEDPILKKYLSELKAQLTKNKNVDSTAFFEALIKSDKFKNYISEIFPSADIDDPLIKDYANFYFWRQKCRFPGRLSNDQIIALYFKLLKNFESNGQKISYELLDVEYKNYDSGYFNIPHFWYCYGYDKEWIFGWTFFSSAYSL